MCLSTKKAHKTNWEGAQPGQGQPKPHNTTKLQRCKSQPPREPELHTPEANFAGVVQAVFLDVGLEVGGAAHGSTLRAAVRGLVGMNPLVGTVTALVGQHHLAHLTRLMEERLH